MIRFVDDVTSTLDQDGVRLGLLPRQCYSIPELKLRDGGDDKQAVLSALTSRRSQSRTTADLIRDLCEAGFTQQSSSRRIGVLVVDGSSVSGGVGALSAATAAAWRAHQELGVELLVVAVGPNVGDLQAAGLAGPQGSRNVLRVDSYADLSLISSLLQQRLDAICLREYPYIAPVKPTTISLNDFTANVELLVERYEINVSSNIYIFQYVPYIFTLLLALRCQ